jgi:hypothetical protein
MFQSRLAERRYLMRVALFSPILLLGCEQTPDGKNVKIGDSTKAEAKARADFYRAKAAAKKPAAGKKR